jgi:hypothetical protein
MGFFSDSILKKSTPTKTTKKSSGFFSEKILGSNVRTSTAVATAPIKLPPSKSPFNPNTPGHDEFNRQLDMRAGTTSTFKNFFSSIVPAAKEVGSLAVGSQSLPGQMVKQYTQPSDMVRQAESTVPNFPGLKQAGQAILRTIIPIAEGFGTIVGEDVLHQRELADELNKRKFTQTVGRQVQSNKPDYLVTHKLTAEEIVNVTINSVQVGLLISPFLTKMGQKGSLKLSEAFTKESKVPITYSDLQKITTSTSDSQAISRVGIEKFNAYQDATRTNTVRQALKDGYVTLAKKEPTVASNIFKNAATRPLTEIGSLGKTYGADVSVPRTPLLPEIASSHAEIASRIQKQGQQFSIDILNKYLKVKEKAKTFYIIKQLPEPPKVLSLPSTKNQKLLTTSTNKYGEGFVATDKPNKAMVQVGKALSDYRVAVQNYNQKPTPTKLRTALKARQTYLDLKNPPTPNINAPFAHELVAPESKPFANETRSLAKLKGGLPANNYPGSILEDKFFSNQLSPVNKPFAHEIGQNTLKTAPETTTSAPNATSDKEFRSLAQEVRKYKSAEEFVRGQGEPLLHGTTKEFTEFDLSKAGTRNRADQGFAGKGIYLTNSKEIANTFASGKDIFKTQGGVGSGRVVETYLDPELRVLEVNDFAELADKLGLPKASNRPNNVKLTDFISEQSPKIRQKAMSMGYDAIKIDGGGLDKFGTQTYEMVVFDPKNIKTKSQLTDFYNQVTKSSVTPKKPVESNPSQLGQTPSKIAQSIQSKAVEQKLTEGFEGIAGYDKITIKDQAERASQLLTDPDKTLRVIKGEEALPEGLRGTALITAAEEYIKKTGDVKMAYELANSPLVSETSAAAQELRLAAEREPDSLVAKLQEVKKARETAAVKRYGDVKKATKQIKTAIKAEITKTTPKAKDWVSFLEELKCS